MYQEVTKWIRFTTLAASVMLASTVNANSAKDLHVESIEHIQAPAVTGLQAISDDELSDVQGQALLDFSQQVNSDGIQFLKLLLNAKLETNLNRVSGLNG